MQAGAEEGAREAEAVFGEDATDPRTQMRTFLENVALVSSTDKPDQEKVRCRVCLSGSDCAAHTRLGAVWLN
jgi:hypothetical protein